MERDQQANSNSSFVVVGIAFIMMIGVTIGLVFYFHSERVKTQKALYADYVAFNAWRGSTQRAYAKLSADLDVLESMDPAKGPVSHSAYVAVHRSLVATSNDLTRVPSGPIQPGVNLRIRVANLIDVIRRYTEILSFTSFQPHDPTWRSFARNNAYWALAEQRRSEEPNLGDPDWQKKTVALRKSLHIEANKLNDARLQELLIQACPQVRGQLRFVRNDLVRLLSQPEIVPRGLDLEYARKLK